MQTNEMKGDNYIYYQRKESGLCPNCGIRKPAEGIFRCRECSDLASQKQKIACGQRKAAGLCTECGKKLAIKGRTRCADCTERAKKNYRKRQAEKAKTKKTGEVR